MSEMDKHRQLWELALENERGAATDLPTKAAAIALRQRLYKLRDRERKTLQRIYGEGTPCPWDRLTIVIEPKDTGFMLYVRPTGAELGEIYVP